MVGTDLLDTVFLDKGNLKMVVFPRALPFWYGSVFLEGSIANHVIALDSTPPESSIPWEKITQEGVSH